MGGSVLSGPQQSGHAQREGAVPPAPRCLSSGSWPCPLEPGAGVSHPARSNQGALHKACDIGAGIEKNE